MACYGLLMRHLHHQDGPPRRSAFVQHAGPCGVQHAFQPCYIAYIVSLTYIVLLCPVDIHCAHLSKASLSRRAIMSVRKGFGVGGAAMVTFSCGAGAPRSVP
jgi:hypothetical protein